MEKKTLTFAESIQVSDVLTSKKAAAFCCMSKSSWTTLRDKPPSFQIGKTAYWRKSTLKRWLKALEKSERDQLICRIEALEEKVLADAINRVSPERAEELLVKALDLEIERRTPKSQRPHRRSFTGDN